MNTTLLGALRAHVSPAAAVGGVNGEVGEQGEHGREVRPMGGVGRFDQAETVDLASTDV